MPAKYIAIKWHKIVFFLRDLNLFRQDIKKICLLISMSAKPQQWPKNRRLSPLVTNFGKKLLPLHRRRFKSLFVYFFALIFFTLTQQRFFFCKFFAKGLKSEGERLKVKFSFLEIVKIGRGQQNYRPCR